MKLPYWPVPYSYSGKKGINSFTYSEHERVLRFLELLDNPHTKLPPIIHVAGTNGKGSTLAYLKAIFENAEYVVHRYTSPHLIRFNERITIAGKEIDDKKLYYYIEKCRKISEGREDIEYTFFEATTCMAFLIFSEHKADILLLETGLGGRIDATNVVENPMLTIITPISYDHMEYLGDTLSKIATEKAGIIKPAVPCVISWQYSEVMSILKEAALKVNAPYLACGEDWNFEIDNKDGSFHVEFNQDSPIVKQIFDKLNLTKYKLGPYKQSLIGIHQSLNAATAVVSAIVAKFLRYNLLNMKNINDGLKKTYWPARMEKIDKGRLYRILPNNWEMWLDGAHNLSGAEMVSASINNMSEKLPLYIINGRTIDRDITGFLKCFIQLKPELICCNKVEWEPKTEDPEVIYKCAIDLGFDARVFYNLESALEYIKLDAQNKNIKKGRVLICGSLFLAGDVLMGNREG